MDVRVMLPATVGLWLADVGSGLWLALLACNGHNRITGDVFHGGITDRTTGGRNGYAGRRLTQGRLSVSPWVVSYRACLARSGSACLVELATGLACRPDRA